MGFWRGITRDGRLRKKHERLEERGERPPYLIETYNTIGHLQEEANLLHRLGYRIQSRQDIRGSAGFYYHVTFEYRLEVDTLRSYMSGVAESLAILTRGHVREHLFSTCCRQWWRNFCRKWGIA